MEEIAALDFFGGHNRQPAELVLRTLEGLLRSRNNPGIEDPGPVRLRDFQGRTWVTRQDIHVARMASAWLIRRFIYPRARFRFAPKKNHVHRSGELRFDMFEGEFTHEGDLYTFEVL